MVRYVLRFLLISTIFFAFSGSALARQADDTGKALFEARSQSWSAVSALQRSTEFTFGLVSAHPDFAIQEDIGLPPKYERGHLYVPPGSFFVHDDGFGLEDLNTYDESYGLNAFVNHWHIAFLWKLSSLLPRQDNAWEFAVEILKGGIKVFPENEEKKNSFRYDAKTGTLFIWLTRSSPVWTYSGIGWDHQAVAGRVYRSYWHHTGGVVKSKRESDK